MRNRINFCALVALLAACGESRNVTSSRTTNSVEEADSGANGNQGADEPLECNVATDCDDGNKGTTDSCVDGQCVNIARPCPEGHTMDPLGNCDFTPADPADGDVCSRDFVDPATGEARNPSDVCDDGNVDTSDSCVPDAAAVLGFRCESSCREDDNPCTSIALVAGTCTASNLIDGAVCGDGAICLDGTCAEDACRDAGDCQDGNSCTRDDCVEGVCLRTLNAVACEERQGFTVQCIPHEVRPNVNSCEYTANPEDPARCPQPPENFNACVEFACVQAADGSVSLDERPALNCQSNDPALISTCEEIRDPETGEQIPSCIERARCSMNEQFLDRNSDGNGECVCAEGFGRLEEDGPCLQAREAEAGCEDGELACDQFIVANSLAHVECRGGQWLLLEACNTPESGFRCLPERNVGCRD